MKKQRNTAIAATDEKQECQQKYEGMYSKRRDEREGQQIESAPVVVWKFLPILKNKMRRSVATDVVAISPFVSNTNVVESGMKFRMLRTKSKHQSVLSLFLR